ncbi:MAG: hypothetical protein IJ530_01030 [Treponema sp.]|uniref:hypothetical protein n=1 Tax=Treponema sp. TaxID=166 RepID=UPI0025E8F3BB|nr:hypothetical protein [Treponema sp.]MBQ8678328.1 hypothetical protein [Treponema sp.]
MVRMTNIRQKDNYVSMDCFVENNRSDTPSFSLKFDPLTEQILSDVTSVDKSYLSKVMYKISSIIQSGQPLPEKSCVAWY